MSKRPEDIFNKDLSQIDNLYLVFGTEEYLLDKFENKFKDNFIEENIRDFNLTYIKEEEEVFKNIVSKGSTLPIMSEKRFIIVKAGNILKQNVGNFAVFEKFIDDIPDTTVLLILINDDISKNKKKKIISKKGNIVNLQPPKYEDLNKWIKNQFKQRDKKIDYRGIRILEKMFNNNLQQLDSEIDKICTYVDNKNKVELSDIKKVISKDRRLMENEIFKFLDAVSNKEKEKSLYLFHHMLENGEIPQIIFAMLSRRIKLMLMIKDLKEQGINPKQIAKKIGEHPYPVKRIYGFVDKYSATELEKTLDKFLKVDVKLKTGLDSIEDAIQNAIISI